MLQFFPFNNQRGIQVDIHTYLSRIYINQKIQSHFFSKCWRVTNLFARPRRARVAKLLSRLRDTCPVTSASLSRGRRAETFRTWHVTGNVSTCPHRIAYKCPSSCQWMSQKKSVFRCDDIKILFSLLVTLFSEATATLRDIARVAAEGDDNDGTPTDLWRQRQEFRNRGRR